MLPTTSAPGPSITLTRLLDDELRFSPVLEERYSNHLPMALVALHRLGADAARLQRWFDEDRESEPRVDLEALDQRLREIALDGIATTVRARVPALAHGPSSQLFHPLIRLAYALDAGHAGQVAAALLDWEQRHVELPLPETDGGGQRLSGAAAVLAAQASGAWGRTFDLEATARRPAVQAALSELAPGVHTPDDLSEFTRAVHVGANDFLTLHLVTGARAVRTLCPWLDQATAQRLLEHAARAILVVYASLGAPPLPSASDLDDVRERPLPDRRVIAERALASEDPHVVKLADVALVEEARTGDRLDLFMAARAVGLA